MYYFFNFFQIHFGIVYTWHMYHSFDQRVWFMVIFFLSKRAKFFCKYEFFFVKLSYILSQFLLSWAELWKYTPTILMENCGQAICLGLSNLLLYVTPHKGWLFKKFIFELKAVWDNSKINSILVTQLKSLRKMVVYRIGINEKLQVP